MLNDPEEIRSQKRKEAERKEAERKRKARLREKVEKFRSKGYKKKITFSYSGEATDGGDCEVEGIDISEEGSSSNSYCEYNYSDSFLGNDGDMHEIQANVDLDLQSEVVEAQGLFSAPEINGDQTLSLSVYMDGERICYSRNSDSGGFTFRITEECNKINKSLKNDHLRIDFSATFRKSATRSPTIADVNCEIERLDWKSFEEMVEDF